MKLRIVFLFIFIQGLFVFDLWASSLPEVAIHGFISQGYLQSDENNLYYMDSQEGTFEFNEMGLNFNTQVTDGLKLGLQLFARDFGNFGNDEVVVHWAYADYFYRKWFGIRAGKIPITHGFYNGSRDIDILRVNILLPQSVYPELLRDVFLGTKGIECYGELPGGFSYQLNTGDMNLDKESSFVTIYREYFSTEFDSLDIRSYVNGSIIWTTPVDNLRIGTTAIHTKLEGNGSSTISLLPGDNNINMEYNVLTLSAEFIWRNFSWAAEYSQFRNKYDVSSTNPLLCINDDVLNTGGFYTSVGYRFTDWFEIGGYYSEFYYDLDERKNPRHYLAGSFPSNSGYLKETTLSMRFDLNEFWLLKLEAHSMRGYYLHGPSNNGSYHNKWFLYAAKVTYSF